MRSQFLVRCSASVLALAVSSPVWSQATAPAPAAEAEETEIIVTGIRESLASSRNLKRNAVQVIDTVVAEDIGKLPDIAVSDTAARLPGVQVVRLGGEASQVLVRGLDERYFNTVYNGREIFTAERRQVALQDFPSAGIAALEVFKTSTANLVEPGLAGLVNVRSRRPFDFTDGQISGTAWGLYTKQGAKLTPNGNLLVTDRWETGIGEIGVLLNASYTEMQYLDSEPSNTDFIADPTINGRVTRFPDIQRLFYRSGNRVRPSVNGSVQWRPSPGLEFYAEALWQGFRNKIDDRLLAVPLYGATYSNLVYRDGTNLLRSGTATNPGDRLFTFQGATFNKTDTYQYAVGGSYEGGPFKITADVARTESTFTGSTESLDRVFNGTYTVDFDLDTPQFTLRNIELNNPATTTYQGLFEQNQRSTGKDWQARFDTTYTFDDFFVRSIQVGARYTDRQALREFGERFGGVGGANRPASALPVSFNQINPGFRGTTVQPTRSFFSPTYQSIRENIVALRDFTTANGGGLTSAPPVAAVQYTAKEETLAGYAQVNFAFGDTIDGTVGVRATRAKTRVTGTSAGLLPGNGGDDWEFLPNASVRWRIMPELQFRASATQTITRPVFADLNPATSLGAPPSNPVTDPAIIAQNPFVNARRGDAGNPFLQPLRSDNYDAGLEYYFSPTGFAAVTVFRRDLQGFILRNESRFISPTLGPLIITAPFNSGRGRVDGLEVQLQTFFDFEWLPDFARGFGVQANYTLLDAKTDYQGLNGVLVRDFIPNVSKWSYNLVGLYERGPLSARLTYNKRSTSLETRQIRGTSDFYTETASFPARIDLSLNLNFRENVALFFDWTNITGKPFSQSFSSARDGAPRAEYARFLRYEESTFSVGMRFRIGGRK